MYLIRCCHLKASFVRYFHQCRDTQALWESPQIYMPDAEKGPDSIFRSRGSAGIPHPLTMSPIGDNSDSHYQSQNSISKNPSPRLFLLINHQSFLITLFYFQGYHKRIYPD